MEFNRNSCKYMRNDVNYGSSNRQMYDTCYDQKRTFESTEPLNYYINILPHENCNRCKSDRIYYRQDPQLVDIETELRNQTRPLSKCDNFKYTPTCVRSGLCTSTFDKNIPVVPAPELCPILYNNIRKRTEPGYTLRDTRNC
jgi:hypothetical protein